MSTQLANMQAEQAALRQEVEHLEKAEPLQASAAKLIAYMKAQEAADHLLSSTSVENEWVFNRDEKGCCNII